MRPSSTADEGRGARADQTARADRSGGGPGLLSLSNEGNTLELSETHPHLVLMVDEQQRGREISAEDETRPVDENPDPKWRDLYGAQLSASSRVFV
jgi:hypothetical protein